MKKNVKNKIAQATQLLIDSCNCMNLEECSICLARDLLVQAIVEERS